MRFFRASVKPWVNAIALCGCVALIPITLEPKVLHPEVCDLRNIDGTYYLQHVELEGNEEPWLLKVIAVHNHRILEMCGR